VFAGQHTSAILSTWTGLLLFQHPEHLAPLRAEQAEVFGSYADVSLPALDRLEMLERCIKEAERMHPPLVVLMRKILRDFAYGECVVPAGELALVSPALSHRIPRSSGTRIATTPTGSARRARRTAWRSTA
jgi:sterol 14-demethylase